MDLVGGERLLDLFLLGSTPPPQNAEGTQKKGRHQNAQSTMTRALTLNPANFNITVHIVLRAMDALVSALSTV